MPGKVSWLPHCYSRLDVTDPNPHPNPHPSPNPNPNPNPSPNPNGSALLAVAKFRPSLVLLMDEIDVRRAISPQYLRYISPISPGRDRREP